MTLIRKSLLWAGAAAVLATSGVPATAAYSAQSTVAGQTGDVIAQSYDGYRRRYRHRDRVDAGDILTGIGILAGIAIIAGAASDADKNDRNDDRYEPRYDDRDTDQPQPESGTGVSDDDDLGSAVSICTEAAERAAGNGERVNEIRSVTRDGNGWRVEGELAKDGFTCATANGRVDYIRLDEQKI